DTDQEDRGKGNDQELDGELEPVGPVARGDVQLTIGVMHLVDAPQEREAVLRAVVPVVEKIEEEEIAHTHQHRGAEASRGTKAGPPGKEQHHGAGGGQSPEQEDHREHDVSHAAPEPVAGLGREADLEQREDDVETGDQPQTREVAGERGRVYREPTLHASSASASPGSPSPPPPDLPREGEPAEWPFTIPSMPARRNGVSGTMAACTLPLSGRHDQARVPC